MIGSASCRAPELSGRVRDKVLAQASSAVALLGFFSKRGLHSVKKLFPLRLWKRNDQPSQARQECILITRLQTYSRQKISTDHF
jgi:hypothetical protein